MVKNYLPIGFAILLTVLLGIVFFPKLSHPIFSATDHVVISEIQVGGSVANDEFVELYNPTGSDISLSGWRLTKESSSSTTETPLVSSISGTIATHGYFLIANPSYTGSVSADLLYSATTSGIAHNNTVIIYSDNGHTVVDKVGIGLAVDKEENDALDPPDNQSIERKAKSSSTSDTMKIGGLDEFAGNGEDTDNNGNDFVTRNTPQPQNSKSDIEPPLNPTPSETPTVTPSETPTITETPTLTPTVTPTITSSPSDSPTPTVTTAPSNSPTPTLTTVPTLTPSPTGRPNPFPFTNISLLCDVTYQTIHTHFITIQFPRILCRVVRS